jgi:hypothetical protein
MTVGDDPETPGLLFQLGQSEFSRLNTFLTRICPFLLFYIEQE